MYIKKNSIVFSFAILVMLGLASCGNRNSDYVPDVDTTQYALATEEGPGHDDARELNPVEVDYGGKHYVIQVSIAPEDSLPKVKDSYGDPYLDNRVKVKVSADGGTLFSRSFTKADFAEYIKDNNPGSLILGGLAFNKLDGAGYHFGAQLNAPGDEEGGVAFKVVIPLGGSGLSITRDTTADVTNQEDND